ncbi:FtsB family cell division protein [Atopococcus tabaci]|uniref:FtsB family cell division protein n=1 Tax=Atopococcus tabaci TaxID=269774 RepID=UPI0004011F7F|nr:septum formation initiator family protein [Atopococcus tabaci]
MKKQTLATITRLNNAYTQEKTLQAHRERKRKRVIRKRTTLITAVGVFLLGVSGVKMAGSQHKLTELEAQTEAAQQELESVQTYQDDLNYYIGMLEDEDYVAKLARGQYFLTKEDEIVFNLPEDAKSDEASILEEENESKQNASSNKE